jgi:acyl carrier protein
MQSFRTNVIGHRVIGLVASILAQNGIDAAIKPDSRLGDIGMTSMDMVGLMLSVEAEFDMAIPQAEITAENFQSVAAIERLVMRQSMPRPGAGQAALRAVA